MKTTRAGILEETAPGMIKTDTTWMTSFYEAFCDCIIETDAQLKVIHIIKTTNSTFSLTGILGKSFLDIVVDKSRAEVEEELELLRTASVPYRRFTFLAKTGRYYRWTVIAEFSNGTFTGLRGVAMDATEQTVKENTLNWQRAIIEGSSDFISITDLDGNVLYTNPGTFRMLGYDPSLGTQPPERIFSEEHLKNILGEGMQKVINGGFWTSIGELVCADGIRKPIEHNMFSVRNSQEETILIATIIRDISDFVEHEKSMQKEQRRTELLASVAMSFSLSDDIDININKALSSIGSYMRVDAMYIRRDDQEKQCFVSDYLWSNTEEHGLNASRDVTYINSETGSYTSEYKLLQSVPIFVASDMSALEDNLFIRARKAGIKSMVCMPIHVDDKFWGYISLSMYSSIRVWTDADISFIKTICGIISTSLEKRLMSRRWQAAQADLQAVVQNYPGIIWSLNANRRFTLYDGAFLKASGEKISGIVGQNMHEYAKEYPGVIHPSMLEMVERTFMGEPQDWMMETQNAVFRCNTMPIMDIKGVISELTGVVGASVDVTGMIKMQKELEKASKAAEAASIAKSEFLSRMSHEIRTPMNAIIGMTQIAQNSGDEERIKNCLNKIDSASKHLLALINDILDISKIEANKLELQYEVFDLGKCIDNIRSMIAIKVEERKQIFSLSVSESLPKYVIGDELRLTQVIINLLGNAIKFTPEAGTISLNVAGNSRENEECVLEVSVKDSGIGVTPEHQKKLFTPFEQGDGSITREYGGTGLGLAICKNIVELMGGGIWMDSVIGQGSTFAFTVVMQIAGDAEHEQIREVKSKHRRDQEAAIANVNDLERFTTLLVEDVDINREIVFAILEDTQIKIETAENGARAVEMFTADPEKYDIILMDLQMPVMDGIEATRRIRQMDLEKAKSIPIVAMTANAFKEDVDKCRDAGMNDHIAKPIDSRLLMEKLANHLLVR